MSLSTVVTNLLALKPKIWIEGTRLYAASSIAGRVLSLFSRYRKVIVDRKKKFVYISTKKFWVFESVKVIPFSNIERIDYSYFDIATRWIPYAYETTDQVECFTVSLCLIQPEEKVKLFSFIGEGAVETGWIGVLQGDEIVDFCGDQAPSSRNYVNLLMKFTGKFLTPHI